MTKLNKTNVMTVMLLTLGTFNMAYADNVKILAADLHNRGGNLWSVNVTLKHNDTGWDHYANRWRVVDNEGNMVGDRVLHHPHVDEQPFTRGLGSMKVPEGITTLYIEAHDKVHGWTPKRLKLDLNKANGGRLMVEAK